MSQQFNVFTSYEEIIDEELTVFCIKHADKINKSYDKIEIDYE